MDLEPDPLHLLLTGNPTERRNGAAYVAADAGLPPTEATALRVNDLTLDARPPTLTMPANRSFLARTIRLESFHARAFAVHLHLQSLDTTLLVYRPRKNTPGSDKAASSTHGVLGRFLTTLGVTGDDLTASCVYLWGIRRVLDHGSIAEALLATGYTHGDEATLLKLVGRDQAPTPAPSIHTPEHRNGF